MGGVSVGFESTEQRIRRKVDHIDEREGPRGGTYWRLGLECGHFAWRHRRVPNGNTLTAVGKTAPRWVYCPICPLSSVANEYKSGESLPPSLRIIRELLLEELEILHGAGALNDEAWGWAAMLLGPPDAD
jgi:hypothetical protein